MTMTPRLTKEYVERLRAQPETDAVREAIEAARRFEKAVGSGEIDGDVTGPEPDYSASNHPPVKFPLRRVKEPPR